MQSVLYGYEFGLTLATTTAGIMYPLMLKIGTDKNELIMILSAIASIGLLVLVSAILTPLTGEMNMKHSLVGAISTMIALGIFIGSYFISIKRKIIHWNCLGVCYNQSVVRDCNHNKGRILL